MSDRIVGFEPVFDANSRVLILGSFPSVKSREVDFYYGNPRNRFWGMLYSYFQEPLQIGTENRREFLARRGVALWDVVMRCRIVGSQDASITDYEAADLSRVLSCAPIERILLNGKTAYSIFKKCAQTDVPALCLPSTSPANPRFNEEEWRAALDLVFANKESARV